MQIKTTVRVEVTGERGERFVVEREARCNRGDNPRFVAADAYSELNATSETLVSQIVEYYGGEAQLAERRAERGR